MKIWRIAYMDRKGAYHQRVFSDADQLVKFCSTLRREAEITDADNNPIGAVMKVDDMPGNRKWAWWFDNQNDLDTRNFFTE